MTIAARTMEFSFDIRSNLELLPAGTKISTLSWDGKNDGFTCVANYGFGGAVERVNIRKAGKNLKAPETIVMECGFSVPDRTAKLVSK